MRFLFTVVTVLMFGELWSQSADDYVKTIERLRNKGKLTTKSSTDKTFVGSVTAYYDKDSLVLINSLTDGESGGAETLYFLKNGVLMKVLTMSTAFDSSDEWSEYYSKHKSIDKCYTCHGKRNCIVTEITFGEKPTIVTNKKKRELAQDEMDKMTTELRRTSEELKILLKEL
jgi:antitoxin component YwqK of YwqJK toxin-antitoxin module